MTSGLQEHLLLPQPLPKFQVRVLLLLLLAVVIVVVVVVVILVVVVVSFINQGSYHPVVGLLDQLLNPLLGPLRNTLPTLGPLDFSPLIALLLLSILEGALRTASFSL